MLLLFFACVGLACGPSKVQRPEGLALARVFSGSSSKAHMPSARRDSRRDKIAREASLGHAKATRVATCELRRVARFFAAIACACLLSAQSQDSPRSKTARLNHAGATRDMDD